MASPEVATKWLLRTRKGPDITIDTKGSIEGISWEILRKWQKEFQEDFCQKCKNFDQEAQNFIRIGHPNNPTDCAKHWTDIVGMCCNFRSRERNKKIDELLEEPTISK